MKAFEYVVDHEPITFPFPQGAMPEMGILKARGLNGWELTHIENTIDTRHYYFKREIVESKTTDRVRHSEYDNNSPF